jgi:hypothetical protein
MSEEKRHLTERCEIKVIDGHIEAECLTKEDRDELARAFEEEAILRVKPKVAVAEEETPIT